MEKPKRILNYIVTHDFEGRRFISKQGTIYKVVGREYAGSARTRRLSHLTVLVRGTERTSSYKIEDCYYDYELVEPASQQADASKKPDARAEESALAAAVGS